MPDANELNLYRKFVLFLNENMGQIQGNDAKFYGFLNHYRITHYQLTKNIRACVTYYKDINAKYPYVLYHDGRRSKNEGGKFYLTRDGYSLVYNKPINTFPPEYATQPKIYTPPTYQEPKTSAPRYSQEEIERAERLAIAERERAEVRRANERIAKEKEKKWTKEEVIRLLTTEAHVVGRMLGHGYNLLEPIHGEWIKEWLLNPSKFKIMIHQAHRGSYKSTCLRLAVAIFMILNPLVTIIVLRKSEDAVKELINGVSKILDTPLFNTFVNILYPDINSKGGFKKTTDTALSIDTNLNVNLSGEHQVRALGLGSPLTGKHAEFIITDDIVTTSDRESEAERYSTIAKYQELMNILSTNKSFSNSRVLNIGTPWHEEDAFSLMQRGLLDKSKRQEELENIPSKNRTDEQNEEIRRLNMKRGMFVYNCYQTGLMTEEDIVWQRKTLNDDVLFAANYMLSLVSDDEKPFPIIDNTGHYSKSFFQGSWEVFAAIDAAYAGEDSTSLSIGAYDWDKFNTVVYGKLYKQPLDKIYLELAEEMWNCGVSTIFMENNTDKGLMGDKFRELGFNVVSYHEHTNKHQKIVASIRPFWRESGEQFLPCVQFVEETDKKYLSQIHDYKKGVRHDDAPDNLACLLIKSKFGVLSVRVT